MSEHYSLAAMALNEDAMRGSMYFEYLSVCFHNLILCRLCRYLLVFVPARLGLVCLC